MSERRYVVLRHEGVPDPHFDLMFEHEGALLTWRSPHWPPQLGAALEKLPDHRLTYLNYEGPISGERGVVTRVASGSFSMHARGERISFLVDETNAFVLKRKIKGLWTVDGVSIDD